MSGLSFGSVELTASGLVAGGGCSTASWSSSTSVSCVSGSASGQLGTSSVTVGAVAGTGLSVYSFDGPVVCIAMVNSRIERGELCDSERAELRECGADSIWACCRRGMQHGVLELVDECELCVGECERAAGDIECDSGGCGRDGAVCVQLRWTCGVHCDGEQRIERGELCDSERAELRECGADSIWACCRRGMQHGVLELVDECELCVGECERAAGDIECDSGGCGRDGAVCVQLRWTCGVHCDGEQRIERGELCDSERAELRECGADSIWACCRRGMQHGVLELVDECELCVGECERAAGDIECDSGGCGRDGAVCVQLRWTCGVHCDA